MEKSLYDDENLLLIALLKEVRAKNKLSQDELAKRLGTYKGFISKYELGQRRLDLVEIRHILQALDEDFLSFMRHYDKECKELPRSLVRDARIRGRLSW